MGRLIDDILELSRATRSDMNRLPVNLSAMAEAIVAELREEEPSRDVDVCVQPGLRHDGDRQLLRVVLRNLLENAWKFTAPRQRARIEVGVLPPGAAAEAGRPGQQVFFVRDDGVGFDMEYAHKLFGVFQRLHGASEFPGSGVGLATVQRIVHRHGGEVWAEGGIDEGATVYFVLS
jgi:signal transduction histidine kinase